MLSDLQGLAARLRAPSRLAVLLGAVLLAAGACDDHAATTARKQPAVEVIEGDAPTWPSELESVRFGQPLEGWQRSPYGDERLASKRFRGVTYHASVDARSGALELLRVELVTREPIADLLAQRWGAPLLDEANQERRWVNPATGLRAHVVDDGWFSLTPYQPLAAFLGGAPGPLAFEENAPLLGKTADELSRAYPEHFDAEHGHFALPPTEHGPLELRVHPSFGEDRRVDAYHFTLRVPGAQKAEAKRLLATKFAAAWSADDTLEAALAEHRLRVRADASSQHTIDVFIDRLVDDAP